MPNLLWPWFAWYPVVARHRDQLNVVWLRRVWWGKVQGRVVYFVEMP